jgi:aminopeptidase N
MKHFPFIFLFVFRFVSSLHAQESHTCYINDALRQPRERVVDFKHLRLEVSFDPAAGQVNGKVTHVFSPVQKSVDSVFLDGPGIKIKEAFVNGKKAEFRIEESGVTVFFKPALKWETKDSLTLIYEAKPRKGIYFIGWNDPANLSRKQIWTQGQGIDNRNWIPMYDEMNDKITSEIIVRFDSKYKVLSNGTRLSQKNHSDGTSTWHYRMKNPHSPYLIMLGIGEYEIYSSKSGSGVPMHMYYYPGTKNRVEPTYRYSEKMMDWFENEIGVKYGWESYSQIPVQDFMYGAMENTTATVFGDFLLVDSRSFLDRPYVGVNAHELAHQWFGDLITARSAAHHWLQESFATYYNQMYEREVFGMDYFNWARRVANVNSLEETKKNNLPVAHSGAGSVRHYPKGAFVLNMLKYVVGGREAFNKAIKVYLERHKYGNVDSHDLLVAFEETLGYSLGWFWDQWIYRGGEPHYSVSFRSANGTPEFSVEQIQAQNTTTGLFKMPIRFSVFYKDGSQETKTAWIEKQHSLVKMNPSGSKEISYVLFDPNSEILKWVQFEKPLEYLQAQALKAEHMIDRYDAIVGLRNYPLDKKKDILLKAFEAEKFHAIRSEALNQLCEDGENGKNEILKKALADRDANVRKTAMGNAEAGNKTLVPPVEKLLTDSSYAVIVLALEFLFRTNPDGMGAYLERTAGVEGTVGKNVMVKWLEVSYRLTAQKNYADELVKMAGISYEFRTRVNAMESLRKTGYFTEALIPNLLDAYLSENSRLSYPALETLRFFATQVKNKVVIQSHIDERPWEDWQREKINRLF